MLNQKAVIFEEKSEVIDQIEYDSDQFIITLKAPKASKAAKPGEFAFVDCGENNLPVSYTNLTLPTKRIV